MAISYDNILKESEEFYKNQESQALANKNATFDQQVNNVNQNYDFAVKNTNTAYEDKYRQNAIQKLINERQVAENMANMGISNSGLSRSQAAATQLSYANQKGELDRQKQQQVDTLERERASTLTDVETNRRAALDSVTEYYTGLKQNMASSRYNTDVEAETSQINAKIKADNDYRIAQENNAHEINMLNIKNEAELNQAIALKKLDIEAEAASMANKAEAELYKETELKKLDIAAEQELAKIKNDAKREEESNKVYTYSGVQEEDEAGNLVNVYTDSKGNKHTAKVGYNPYTGANNNKKYAYEAEQYGFFSNGYQPKGIKGYGPVKQFDSINITGKPQNVWRTSTRSGYQYWIWSGQDNKYVSVVKKDGNWVVA
ncbi:MAG: hypothetical protein J6D52_08070 [Clostridia bacterium]|nr:hypothetical protein [Clostridia bacterium]